MSVRQSGSRFMADFMVNGYRHRKQFPSIEEATAWEAELKKRIRLDLPYQELLDAKNGVLTITELLDKTYQQYWKDSANEDTQLVNIRLITNFFGEEMPANALTTDRLDTFVKYLRDTRGLAASTINGRLATISKAYTYGVERGYISKKPKIERQKVSNNRLRFLTEEEEYEILTALRQDGREDFAMFMEWSIDTGIRPIESRNCPALALREDPEIGHLVDLRKTKNAYPRTIPLTTRAYNAFENLAYDAIRPFAQFTENTIRKNWKFVRDVMQDSDPEFVFYLTRHTCASRLVQRNVPLHVVKEWMGHKTYEMTLRYAKLTPRNFLDAKVALEAPLSA